MTYRPVALTVSIAALLQVLTGCKCPEPETGEHELQRYPSEEELAEALDENGELTEGACETLCQSSSEMDVEEVYGCELEAPTSTASTTSSAADPLPPESGETADTGSATEPPLLVCDVYGTYTPVCMGGRDHAAIASRSSSESVDPVRAWLQGTTHAEAASVKAFVALAAELQAHGAPEELVTGCRDAARDEVAHARMVGELASERGVQAIPLAFVDPGARSLLELARENAVEGCVREVWAAALAHWQASHATDEDIRHVMAPIARDEARHGDLARRIHDWAMSRLTEAERAEVQRAQQDAVAELLASVADGPDRGFDALGLPSSSEASRLLAAMADALWREPAVA